jgi:Glutamate-cysteine ligase family 2(GCS2)
MGADIAEVIERSEKNIAQTRKLIFQEITRQQQLAYRGAFNKQYRTCDIEHEMRALDATTGQAINAEVLFDNQVIKARPDTTVDNVEFDANGITPLTPDGIARLYQSFAQRLEDAQRIISATIPTGILVPIGVHPLLTAEDGQRLIVADPAKRTRYEILEHVTIKENVDKQLNISHPMTGEMLEDTASNLTSMTRCSGTQFHIAECTVEEALSVHNISIAIAPVMIALFGNSPYIAGVDTGRASARIELLRNGEQRRAGLPLPALTLEQYYIQQLGNLEPPFMELTDPARALQLSHGAVHTVSRIQIDLEHGTIRNEFRHIDSQSPIRAIQAFLLTLGLIESLKQRALPPYQESQFNFQQSVFGLDAQMYWFGRPIRAQELSILCIKLARTYLKKNGLARMANVFLGSLQSEVRQGKSQADAIRRSVNHDLQEGASKEKAIIQILQQLNRKALERDERNL